MEREAEAVLHDNARNAVNVCFHNRASGRGDSARYAPPGSQPAMSIDEQVECKQAVLSCEECRAALKKLRDRRHVSHDGYLERWQLPFGGGSNAPPRPSVLFPAVHPTDNGYARPLERIRRRSI